MAGRGVIWSAHTVLGVMNRGPRAHCFLALTGVALVGGCAETFDSSYASVAQANEAGAVARGWVPQWLPSGSRNIHEVHNIETNARMLTADLPLGSKPRLPSECSIVSSSELPKPPFARPWWFADIPEPQPIGTKHKYWKCDGLAVAVLEGDEKIFIWAQE